MASIITNKLKKAIADSIYDDIFSRRNNYFYFFGKPQDGVQLEETPLNTREYEAKVRANIVAAKKVYSSDVAFVVPRFNWQSGNVYDKTSSLETGIVSATTGPKFYVYDTLNYRVYKCINNNSGAASTVRPTSTSPFNQTTADGYIWRYLFTIPTGLRSKFLTSDYMPVFNSLKSRYYSDGGLNNLNIIKSGSGYTQATTTIQVVGDGTGAILEPVIYNGKLGDIIVLNPGRDYTRATLIISDESTGQGAEVVAELTVGDLDSDQALVELLSTPGTIDSVDVLVTGTEYTTATAKVIGDGKGATVQAIIGTGNTVSRVIVTDPGSGYSWANIVITPQVNPSRSGAAIDIVTRVNVSSFLGHGRDVVDELYANSLMIFGSVFSDRLSDFDVVTTYKQHGLIKNIRNFDYSPNVFDRVSPNRYQLEADFGPLITFYSGGGLGAIGRVNVTGKVVQNIFIEDAGSGYKSSPTVVIGGPGTGAVATATIKGTLDDADINLTYRGVGYYSPPGVTVSSITGYGGRMSSSLTTGIGAVAITNQGSGYPSAPAVTFVGGGGSGAAATAYISNGKIIRIEVTNPGAGYTTVPAVEFNGLTNNATGVASLTGTVDALTIDRTGSDYETDPIINFRGSSGISKINVTDIGELFSSDPIISITGGGGNGASATAYVESSVRYVNLTNQGNGYTSATVTITGGGGSDATAVAVIDAGKIVAINITNRGYNFTSNPTVDITGDGAGATATAVFSSGITSINITNTGSGYTTNPIISVSGGGASRKGFILSPVLGSPIANVGIIGSVSDISLVSSGSGYTSSPAISFTGGSGTGAIAYSKVVGSVSSITMLEQGLGYTTTPSAVISNGEGIGAVIKPIISGGKITACSVIKGGNNYVLTSLSKFTVGSILIDELDHEFTVSSVSTNNKKSSLIVSSNDGFPLTGIVKVRLKGASDYFYTKTALSQKYVESRFPTACFNVTGVFDVNSVADNDIMTITDQTNGDKYYRVVSSLDAGVGYGKLLLHPLNGGTINTNMVISGSVTFTITNVTEPDMDIRTGEVLMISNNSTEFTQNQDQTLSFRTVINF